MRYCRGGGRLCSRGRDALLQLLLTKIGSMALAFERLLQLRDPFLERPDVLSLWPEVRDWDQ